MEPVTVVLGQLQLILVMYKIKQNDTDILFKSDEMMLLLYVLHCNTNLTKITVWTIF